MVAEGVSLAHSNLGFFEIPSHPPNSSYITSPKDGHQVYTSIWQPSSDITPVAVVVATHGFGEHIHWYDHVFSYFASRGIIVKGFDWRGHGRSWWKNERNLYNQLPAVLKGSFEDIFDDLILVSQMEVDGERWHVDKDGMLTKSSSAESHADRILENQNIESKTQLPTFLFGHSTGSLILLSFLSHPLYTNKLSSNPIRGIIAQSPLLGFHNPVPPTLLYVLRGLCYIYPDFYLPRPPGKDEYELANDPEYNLRKFADPLTHGQLTVRLFLQMEDHIQICAREVENVSDVSVLLVHNIGDKITPFDKTKEYYEKLQVKNKTFKELDGKSHESKFNLIIFDFIQFMCSTISFSF